jgi:hypothetical protein
MAQKVMCVRADEQNGYLAIGQVNKGMHAGEEISKVAHTTDLEQPCPPDRRKCKIYANHTHNHKLEIAV